MRRLFLHWVPRFCLAALVNAPVWAVGLGELTVQSYLNQPFRGEVTLLDAESIDINDLRVELASEDEFIRLGVERVFFLTQVRFEVRTQGAEKQVLLTTEAPVKEPYLDFVMALRWPQGRLLRDYTALIDLPPGVTLGEGSVEQSLSDGASQGSDEAQLPDPTENDLAQGLPEPLSQLAVPASPSLPTAGARYLVVQHDTLWRIASRVASGGVSVEQVMLAIIRMNPQAFQEQNVNGLKAGYRLELPLAADIDIDRVAAIDEVALQNNAWQLKDEPGRAGLTLVADEVADAVADDSLSAAAAEQSVPTPVIVPPPVADEISVSLPDAEGALWVDQTLVAPTQLEPTLFDLEGESASKAASAADLEALTMTVGRLQSTLAQLQEQITERDTELAALKGLLAQRDERLATAVAALAAKNEASLRDRFVDVVTSPVAALGALACFALSLGWIYRRRHMAAAELLADSGTDRSDQAKEADNNINAESYSAGKPQAHESNVASELSVALDAGDVALTAHHSTDAQPPQTQHDSALAIEEPSSADVGSQPPEQSGADEISSVPLTRDDLSLAPADPVPLASHGDESIYGLETDPVDSQLDLARAYIDMGNQEGAYPVLTQVMEEGSLSQQAEARALLNRLDVS